MFRLIDYANKLNLISSTSTENTYQCPICGGKLKLRLETGAYCCFTNYCDSSDIKNKLGVTNNYTNKKYSYIEIVEPIKFTIKDELIKVDNYKLAKYNEFKDRRLTQYIFNDKAKIERVDYKDERKKELFPKYKINNNWIYGASNIFGLFNDRYLDKSCTVLIAEGEKTADVITYATNYLCLSPPTFGWNTEYIIINLIKLRPISAIIYIPDNDEVGINKARLIQQSSWKARTPCNIFSYGDIDISEGEDMVDLYNREIDIKLLIENYVRRL